MKTIKKPARAKKPAKQKRSKRVPIQKDPVETRLFQRDSGRKVLLTRDEALDQGRNWKDKPNAETQAENSD